MDFPENEQIHSGIDESHNNKLGYFLKLIAITTYVVGFILGFALGENPENSYYSEFSYSIASIYWLSAFFSGTFILGFAEIIQLLQIIADNSKLPGRRYTSTDSINSSDIFTDLPEL